MGTTAGATRWTVVAIAMLALLSTAAVSAPSATAASACADGGDPLVLELTPGDETPATAVVTVDGAVVEQLELTEPTTRGYDVADGDRSVQVTVDGETVLDRVVTVACEPPLEAVVLIACEPQQGIAFSVTNPSDTARTVQLVVDGDATPLEVPANGTARRVSPATTGDHDVEVREGDTTVLAPFVVEVACAGPPLDWTVLSVCEPEPAVRVSLRNPDDVERPARLLLDGAATDVLVPPTETLVTDLPAAEGDHQLVVLDGAEELTALGVAIECAAPPVTPGTPEPTATPTTPAATAEPAAPAQPSWLTGGRVDPVLTGPLTAAAQDTADAPEVRPEPTPAATVLGVQLDRADAAAADAGDWTTLVAIVLALAVLGGGVLLALERRA